MPCSTGEKETTSLFQETWLPCYIACYTPRGFSTPQHILIKLLKNPCHIFDTADASLHFPPPWTWWCPHHLALNLTAYTVMFTSCSMSASGTWESPTLRMTLLCMPKMLNHVPSGWHYTPISCPLSPLWLRIPIAPTSLALWGRLLAPKRVACPPGHWSPCQEIVPRKISPD